MKVNDLENLLNLNGEVFPMDNGYWVKFEAHQVKSSMNIVAYKFESAYKLLEVFWITAEYYNQDLLQVILDNNPQSLKELAKLTGRAKSNLSRTLKTLERYGIVELNKVSNSLVPKVKATHFTVVFGLDAA